MNLQTKAEPSQMRLILTFTAIAREQDAEKLRVLISSLERDYAEYADFVQQHVNADARSVCLSLAQGWPQLSSLILSDVAVQVVSKIQTYLKEKQNNVV